MGAQHLDVPRAYQNNGIDRTQLGSGCYKFFTMNVYKDIPDYYYYPLANFSNVIVGKGGVEKMSIFWPKHWWQRATIDEVFNKKENISRQRKASLFETWALRKQYYPSDSDLCWSIVRTYELARDEKKLKHGSKKERDFLQEFKKRITDWSVIAFLNNRVSYWPEEDKKALRERVEAECQRMEDEANSYN